MAKWIKLFNMEAIQNKYLVVIPSLINFLWPLLFILSILIVSVSETRYYKVLVPFAIPWFIVAFGGTLGAFFYFLSLQAREVATYQPPILTLIILWTVLNIGMSAFLLWRLGEIGFSATHWAVFMGFFMVNLITIVGMTYLLENFA